VILDFIDRQLHREEIDLIKKLAKEYADEKGIRSSTDAWCHLVIFLKILYFRCSIFSKAEGRLAVCIFVISSAIEYLVRFC
jgi:hypothetical protein